MIISLQLGVGGLSAYASHNRCEIKCATTKYYYQTQVWSLLQLVNIGRAAQDLLYENHSTLGSIVPLEFFSLNVFSDTSTTWSSTRSWSSLVTWSGRSYPPPWSSHCWAWYLAELSSQCNWSFFIILMKWHCYNVTLLGLVPCITLITTIHYLRVMSSKFRNVTLWSLVLPVWYVAELSSQCHNTILS